MTREEKAIIYFKDMRKRLCDDYLLGVPKDSVAYKVTMAEKEFYDTAIKALEQQPCDKYIKEIDHLRKYISKLETQIVEQKPCEDAISRTDAIRVATGYCHWSNIPKELAKLPSVSTGKTGRWEEVQFKTIPCNKISKAKKCSVCGKRKDKYVTWDYCPNCGSYNGGGNKAKMEVEE